MVLFLLAMQELQRKKEGMEYSRILQQASQGFCSDDDGKCHKKLPDVHADVVPINDDSKKFPPRQAAIRKKHSLRSLVGCNN